MSTNVEANGRSILHKGHGQTHTCAVPDVCKTPSPGGPVPIPYINVATDSNHTEGAESVKIAGNPLANVGSKISTSTGDEPGSAGGLMSSKIKGTVTWQMGSLNVKAESKSVVRFLDPSFHNGNAFNTSFIDPGAVEMSYAADFDGPCPVCGEPPARHAIPSTGSTAAICNRIIRALRAACDAGRVAYKGKRKRPKGYMVGVMICRHVLTDMNVTISNTFAAMSGEHLPEFTNIASQFATVIEGPLVEPEELIGANTANVDPQVLTTNVMQRYAQVIQLDMLPGRRSPTGELITGIPRGIGYTPYGNCAAAKLLARSGHGPNQMTEAWFNPPAAPTPRPFGPYMERVNGIRMGYQEYNSALPAIPSCNTCQRTLFMTMCPPRNCA